LMHLSFLFLHLDLSLFSSLSRFCQAKNEAILTLHSDIDKELSCQLIFFFFDVAMIFYVALFFSTSHCFGVGSNARSDNEKQSKLFESFPFFRFPELKFFRFSELEMFWFTELEFPCHNHNPLEHDGNGYQQNYR
jgi:hypothetical protein